MIFILTGPVHSGKTNLLKEVISVFKKLKYRVDGVLSESIWKKNSVLGYDLIDIKEEKSFPFIRRGKETDCERIGPFHFIPQSLSIAQNIILRGIDADVLVIDEVGPLELKSKGLWPALKQALLRPPSKFLITVRESILDKFIKLVGTSEVKIFDIREKNIYTHMIKALK